LFFSVTIFVFHETGRGSKNSKVTWC